MFEGYHLSAKEDYITKTEYLKYHNELENSVQMILNALRGPDLRGGLVKDVNKIYTEIALIKTSLKQYDFDKMQTDITLLKKCVTNGAEKQKEAKAQAEWTKKQWGVIISAVVSGLLGLVSNIIPYLCSP